MKTPEDVKKALACCENADCKACPYDSVGVSIVDCLEALVGDATVYIKQLEACVPKWISVKDRLPEYYKDVLVIVRNNGALFTIIAYLTIGGIWVHKGFGRVIGVVHHWMPLPEPPKEDMHE